MSKLLIAIIAVFAIYVIVKVIIADKDIKQLLDEVDRHEDDKK